jgi:CelD/BcsL family acetyltransferase involved in cellulose biosynthesis
MLTPRLITREDGLRALVPSWRALLGRASHAQPVLTPLWLLAWWRQFGPLDGRALRVLVVEEGPDLVAMVPLAARSAVHRRAIPVRRLELMGSGEDEADEICSDYVGGLVARGREDEAASAVAAALRRGGVGDWDELRMPAMSAEDPLVARLVRALQARGLSASLTPHGECHYIPLPSTWDGYLQALGSARRYVVTRSLRELDRWAGAGGWELRVAATPGELAEGVRILHELHADRWSAEGRTGVFASERFAAFHAEVMPKLLAGEDGAGLELAWLSVRGEPVAAAYDVVFDDKVHFYQSGRRVDVPKNVRPGIALHALCIQRSIAAGRREYDFLAGGSRYKRDLALAVRGLVTLRVVAPGLRARAVNAAVSLVDRAIARAGAPQ